MPRSLNPPKSPCCPPTTPIVPFAVLVSAMSRSLKGPTSEPTKSTGAAVKPGSTCFRTASDSVTVLNWVERKTNGSLEIWPEPAG